LFDRNRQLPRWSPGHAPPDRARVSGHSVLRAIPRRSSCRCASTVPARRWRRPAVVSG
jgi:hypothetical protein